jgi:putative transposase
VAFALSQGVSERRACHLMGIGRSSARYQAHPRDDEPLLKRLQEIKQKQPRFGIARAHATLRAAGETLNHKRVERVWRKYSLQVRRRHKRRKIKTGHSVPGKAERPNHVWSYDFLEDALLSGRRVRILCVLDEFTREWLGTAVGMSLTSQAVIALLQGAFVEHGTPQFLRSDNGPEFIALEVKAWLEKNGSSARYIDPGCPWQNGYQESFHGKLRDEFLDREAFVSVAEARVRLQSHRRWYNEERPHSGLKYQSPAAFRRVWQEQQEPPERASD